MDLGNLENDNTVHVIPVVIHLLQSPGFPIIPDAVVHQRIQELNEQFNLQHASQTNIPMRFTADAAVANIRFCLAQTDPNGNPTTGIIRHTTTESGPWLNFVPRPKVLAPGWNPNNYLNIWVADINDGSPGSALGYADFPWFGAYDIFGTAVNGVVLDPDAFTNTTPGGATYGISSSILTHEVGHWLGLFHIWGDGPLLGVCLSDQVNDTPIQKYNYWESERKLRGLRDCANDIQNIYFANGGEWNCQPNPDPRGNMIMNFMDYTYPGCMLMFTRGQVLRMRQVLLSQRRDLLMNTSSCLPQFQVYLQLKTENDLPITDEFFNCLATVRGGTGPYTFIWEYRRLEIGSTNWNSYWETPSLSGYTYEYGMHMPNVRSIQIRVTVRDANGNELIATLILRNPLNNPTGAQRLAARRVGTFKKTPKSTFSEQNNILLSKKSLQLSVYPNPASDIISVSYMGQDDAIITVEVLNLLKKQQIQPQVEQARFIGKNIISLNVAHLQTGTYYVRCTSVSRDGNIQQQTTPFQLIK